jgi:hypothetical protein
VGAFNRASGGVLSSGAVYHYTRSGTIWTQESILIAGDKAASDQFGKSVALSADGTRLAVGAYARDSGGVLDSGAVYQYTRIGNAWTQASILTASDKVSGDYFGSDVSLSANDGRLAIGAYARDSGGIVDSGAVYIET